MKLLLLVENKNVNIIKKLLDYHKNLYHYDPLEYDHYKIEQVSISTRLLTTLCQSINLNHSADIQRAIDEERSTGGQLLREFWYKGKYFSRNKYSDRPSEWIDKRPYASSTFLEIEVEEALSILGLLGNPDTKLETIRKYVELLDQTLISIADRDKVSKLNEIVRQIRDIEGIDEDEDTEER